MYLRRWPILRAQRSILDCDPPEIEDPSEDERGVSPPKLEVQVLERERVPGAGLVKTSAEAEST